MLPKEYFAGATFTKYWTYSASLFSCTSISNSIILLYWAILLNIMLSYYTDLFLKLVYIYIYTGLSFSGTMLYYFSSHHASKLSHNVELSWWTIMLSYYAELFILSYHAEPLCEDWFLDVAASVVLQVTDFITLCLPGFDHNANDFPAQSPTLKWSRAHRLLPRP